MAYANMYSIWVVGGSGDCASSKTEQAIVFGVCIEGQKRYKNSK